MHSGQTVRNWVFEPMKTGLISALGSRYCSLPVAPHFYDKLIEVVGKRRARKFLRMVRDAAFLPPVWKKFENEECFQISLLRSVARATESRDHVLKLLGPKTYRVTNQFQYSVKLPGANCHHNIFFDFRASPPVPRRMILFVGANGTGKTQVLANLAIALTGAVEQPGSTQAREKIEKASGLVSPTPSFYSVIAISFNAFDDFEIPSLVNSTEEYSVNSRYTYCGIRYENDRIKTQRELKDVLMFEIRELTKERGKTLYHSMRNVLGEKIAEQLVLFQIFDSYDALSSGQRICANILTHLVSELQEQSLVLIDEPETHLHPALMTRLLSEISSLLEKYNSFAITATHSPLLAQQHTSKSIRVFARSETDDAIVEIPDFECFGENISTLTNKLFNPGETRRDYAELLKRLMQKHNFDAEKVEAEFPDGLGVNAQTYLWSMAKKMSDETSKD
ncbi:MAG: AAA family ATPase [Pseudomonadota bacterium]|nr:AAA family ATPase [Pseudomonadota bacterium]